jgi:hypothetical protein
MKYWLQYHNYDNLGYLPGGYETGALNLTALDTSEYEPSGITTSKRMICDAVGDVVFFIVGYGGKLKKYLLWSWCIVEEVDERDDGRFDAYGTGRVLNPLPILAETPFDEFKRWNANFSLGFRDISNVPFKSQLLALARQRGQFELASSYSEGLKSIPEEIHRPSRLFEGAIRFVAVNVYERSLEARRRCIEHYGESCFVCGFSFAAVYGSVAEGLIHVHHLRALSEIRGEYEVHPIEDLRPVCANCHAVLHRREPAYSIKEVQAFLGRKKSAKQASKQNARH